jgi:hypothetical protein
MFAVWPAFSALLALSAFWQEIAVGVILSAAVGYVVHRSVRLLRRKTTGCCGCACCKKKYP